MRKTHHPRSFIHASILAAACSAAAPWLPVATPAARAQAGTSTQPLTFVTTGATADVPLRSGNYTVFYPVARLKPNQVLAVVNNEDPEWIEVAYPSGTPAVVFAQEGELRERDGKNIVVTTRRSSLSAFNIAASGRSDHYKRIFRTQALPAGTELRFLEAMTDPQSGETFAYKVEAPMNATGFIARSSVRDASATETQRYLASVNLSESQLRERLGLTTTTTVANNNAATPNNTPANNTPNTPATTVTDATATTPANTDAPVEGGTSPTLTMGELEGDGLIAARLDTPPPAPKWDNVEAVKNLDASYETISAEPLETAEFGGLIEEYKALLAEVPEDDTTKSVRDYINARIALLELRQDLQTTLSDLRSLESSHKSASAKLDEISRMSMQGVEYALTGRLERSALYNGEQLPLRYRLELVQPSAGEPAARTLLAYIEPPKDKNLDTLIGREVTVYAKDRVDPKSGFNVIHAREVALKDQPAQ